MDDAYDDAERFLVSNYYFIPLPDSTGLLMSRKRLSEVNVIGISIRRIRMVKRLEWDMGNSA